MLGFDPTMLQPRDPARGAAIREKYGLPDGYILYVGTIQPRKNIGTLIEAYHILKKEGRIACKLVIVGRKGWLYDALFAHPDALTESDLTTYAKQLGGDADDPGGPAEITGLLAAWNERE